MSRRNSSHLHHQGRHQRVYMFRNIRNTSHLYFSEASCLSPSKKATIQYKKEKLIDIFKQIKAGLKVHPNLLKALDKEPTVLLSNGYITLEHIDPT